MREVPGGEHLKIAVALPAAVMSGWARALSDGVWFWQRLLVCQMEMLSHHHAALLRSRNQIARGAGWTDHYGRRNRDVDVERV